MERTPDRPSGDEPGEAGSSAQPPATPTGPQAPAPPTPGPAPQPPGPERPPGTGQPPETGQPPGTGNPPGTGQPPAEATTPPQAPPAPPAAPPQAAPGPEAPPGYGGPAPPGGWQQPVAAQPQAWVGAPLAGWWSRVGAYILDAIFTAIVSWVGVALIYAGSEVAGVLLVLAGLVVAFFYFPVTMMREGAHNGQSLGKQLLGIRVVRDDGQAVGFGFALLRQFVVMYLLFSVAGGFLFGIPWLIDVLWPLWDSENRALHDMIVKSHVMKAEP
jgi:uncharacterized RDD family membrane protein YckC